MARISYGEFQDIISYLQSGELTLEEKTTFFQTKGIESQPLISALSDIVAGGKKHITSLDKILKESGELEVGELIAYANNTNKFLEHHGFAPPLLVKEFPIDCIENFSQAAWAPLTKTDYFKKADYDGRKLALTLAGVYGVFENDQEAGARLSSLVNMLQGKTIEDLEQFRDLEMQYAPQFFRFIKENPELVATMNLAEIQSQWESISRCVDIKTPENIQRYMQIAAEKNGNEFDTYMAYHNVPESKVKKYRIIYEQMEGRTETSLPTLDGVSDRGYSYEMLAFDDIRVMRFGETVKCCQALGNAAETSMINSAVESSSRVIIISDEKGKPVAGSFVTHKLDKEGKSYLCFDSIEVNAAKLPVKAVAYSKTLKKLNKLVKKGIIPDSDIATIEAYFAENPEQKHISKKDLEALRINKKIMEAYQAAAQDIMTADEQKRGDQLAKGEITQEQHDRLLIKNGRITIGRNPVSMYLGDLPEIDKKEMELLPKVTRDLAIYKKAHHATGPELLRRVTRGMTMAGVALGAAMMVAEPLVGGAFLAWGAIGSHKLKRKKVHGQTYSDAVHEQRSLYDGRSDEIPPLTDREQIRELQKKLVYKAFDTIAPEQTGRGIADGQVDLADITRVSDLTLEQRKNYTRLREEVGLGEFSEQDQDRYVMGNGQNWAATITREGTKLTINDVALGTPLGFAKKMKLMTQAQAELMQGLQTLAGRAEEMVFETGDPNIDQYLGKHVDTSRGRDTREQTRQHNHDTEIGH